GGDRGPANFATDGANTLEVLLAGRRKARLDDVDAESVELAREHELLARGHAVPGRLLAVPKRGVEDSDSLHDLVGSPSYRCQVRYPGSRRRVQNCRRIVSFRAPKSR